MANHHQQDVFYEPIGSSRGPPLNGHGQPHTIHRQSSRHFEPFGNANSGLYTAADHEASMVNSRFDGGRYDTARINTGVMQNSYAAFDSGIGSQTWNSASFGAPGLIGGTPRLKGNTRSRGHLPNVWMDPMNQPALPSMNPSPGNIISGLGGLSLGPSSLRAETVHSDPDEELIPTAIVIKNIPFAVKKEQLVQLMTEMQLPLPYAFNYHFDNGVFRGLAFANFTTAEETAAVIDVLNGFDLHGRKLRVEYKKMLPIAERERIEKEKRERRGQLEEQHLGFKPMIGAGMQPGILPTSSPSPGGSQRKPDVDLNDPQTLQFYSQLLLFRDDHTREALVFPSTLSPTQRRIVHTLAHHMGLAHVSRGNGEQRQVHVFRAPPNAANISPPTIPTTVLPEPGNRRTLTRATTMDFTEGRHTHSDAGIYSTIGRQASSLLDVPPSPSRGADLLSHRQNLRTAKSFADLRSYTPSPVPSSASFPAALGAGISRYQDFAAQSGGSATPSLTPTATGTTISGQARDAREEAILNSMSMGGAGLGGSLGVGGGALRDPRDMRGVLGSDRESPMSATSARNFSMGGFEADRDRERGQVYPMRQPRGPDTERGVGFVRNARQPSSQHGRGSGDESLAVQSGVEIVVE